jgi:hypothetical protein
MRGRALLPNATDEMGCTFRASCFVTVMELLPPTEN